MNHSPYTPASGYESKEFKSFIGKFFLAAGLITVLSSYLLSMYLMFYAKKLEYNIDCKYLNFICQRIESLSKYDGVSQFSYVGTLTVATISFVLSSIIVCYSYWKKVINSGIFVPFQLENLIGLSLYLFISLLLIWPTVFDRIVFGKYVGMAAIFTWPIFPIFGSMSLFMVATLSFLLFGAICKIFIALKRRN